MTQMSNQETDTALILENELQRRVREVTRGIIQDEIRKEVKRIFLDQKDSMLIVSNVLNYSKRKTISRNHGVIVV